ncbi:MAG: hypothetical protein R6X02_06170 [Enhygromyxa sp.]
MKVDRRDSGDESEALARLARVLGHRFSGEPDAPRWLAEAVLGWRSLARWRSWGGSGEAQTAAQQARDELLGIAWAVARDRSLAEGERERVERCLAVLAPAPQILGLGLALWIAAGEIDRALACWRELETALGTDPASLACVALWTGFAGLPLAARSALEGLVEQARDPGDLRAAGELLERLRLPGAAIDALIAAAENADDVSSWRRVVQAAVAARERERGRSAAQRMLALARDSAERLEAASWLAQAGAFTQAEAALERLLADPELPADHREAASLALARLELWRLELREAARLAGAVVDTGRDSPAAWRILGATAVLDDRPREAIDHLTRALELDPRDDEALLWRARAWARLADLHQARLDLGRTDMGDRPAWQLVFGLVDQLTPDSRSDARERYFVDHNLRQLLGETPDARPTLERIEDALARLGGNLSIHPTTPLPSSPQNDQPLRWLDELESPRAAAEQLQRRIVHDGPDPVLAAFTERAAAYPDVPTFVTYAAEIHLWRGEYERALELFEDIWETTRTRWGYIGGGAAAMMLGRDERALELWAEGAQHYSPMDTEATYAYRGELYLRRGELELARPELEQATTTSPSRLGAWIALALVHARAGDQPALRRCLAEVEALAPVLLAELRASVGSDPEPLLLAALERMRGNRSSVIYTFVDDRERLRVIPAGELGAWRKAAARVIALFIDELQSLTSVPLP